jgi:predicted permease
MSTVTVAVGVGAALAIIAVVDQALFRPWPYAESSRIFVVREVLGEVREVYPSLPANASHYLAWRRECRGCEDLAAVRRDRATAMIDGRAHEYNGLRASANLMDLLGVALQRGRFPGADEDEWGKGRVIVISDGVWKSQFGQSESVIGSEMRFDDISHTIIGVLPPGSLLPPGDQLGALAGIPPSIDYVKPLALAPWERETPGEFDYVVLGRTRAEASLAQVATEINALQVDLGKRGERPMSLEATLTSLDDVTASPFRRPLLLLLLCVVALLLIVAVNLGSLMISRQVMRTRFNGVRIAVGASPQSLALVAVIESLVVSVAGVLIGLGLASWALDLIATYAPVALPRVREVAVDLRLAAYAAGIALTLGIVCGFAPAIRAYRTDPSTALRSSSRSSTAARASVEWRRWFAAAQVGAAATLISLSGLLASSASRALGVPKGYDPEGVAAVDMVFEAAMPAAARAALIERVIASTGELPGVEVAALTTALPLEGESMVDAIQPTGASRTTERSITANIRYVSPDYFAAAGTLVLAGTSFTLEHRARRSMLVSARTAHALWPGEHPLGRMITVGCCHGDAEVIGVVEDIKTSTLETEGSLVVYLPYWQQPPARATLVARTRLDADALLLRMQALVAEADARVAQPRSRTLAAVTRSSLTLRWFQLTLTTMLAALALTSAIVGIVASLSESLASRQVEIGVRLALGGSSAQVRWLLLRRELSSVGIGLAGSLLLCHLIADLVRPLLFSIEPTDPTLLGGSVLLIGGTAVLLALVLVWHVTARPVTALLAAE